MTFKTKKILMFCIGFVFGNLLCLSIIFLANEVYGAEYIDTNINRYVHNIHSYEADLYSGYVDNEMEYRFETCKNRWLRNYAVQDYIKLTNTK